MSIPESQLEIWAHQGAVTTAKLTKDSIKFALDSYNCWPDNINYDLYLQGSYKNNTNIWGDMDVDIILQLNNSFCSNLNEEQKKLLGIVNASYFLSDFRKDVLSALHNYYGVNNLVIGNKTIKLKEDGSRLPADILVCLQYRNYFKLNYSTYIEGVLFWTRNELREIINYPKLHYDNGVSKNKKCDNLYKPAVRIFKNVRTCLSNKKILDKRLIPSYFLESLLYNVPNDKFDRSYQITFLGVLTWIVDSLLTNHCENYLCQNEQLPLFGNTPEQWSKHDALIFLTKLSEFWENY